MYPEVRLRRLRQNSQIRDLVAEYHVSPENLIQPFFVIEGKGKKEEIATLPGIYRLSIDLLLEQVKEVASLGIKAVALFPVIDQGKKDDEGSEAFNLDNLVCSAIKAIKEAKIDILIICDVALDPYTSHGHDGIIVNDDVDNDLSIDSLVAQSLTLAKAGADILAPSDMMDGRIGFIREALEEGGYHNIMILSYSMKYASNLYGPFRDSVHSKNSGKEVRKNTYQADMRGHNSIAIREIEQDIEEGADMVIIKPASYYLDVIQLIAQNFDIPVFAYQVSGEYSMIKFAHANKAIEDPQSTMLESLIAIRRAGANSIITYGAMEMAKYLKTIK